MGSILFSTRAGSVALRVVFSLRKSIRHTSAKSPYIRFNYTQYYNYLSD